jgi:hypothetical protein
MFKAWIQSFVKAVAVVPAAFAALYSIIQAAKHTHLDTVITLLFARMQGWTGFLFEILTDHWLAYILLAAIIAFIWSFIVVLPKIASKANFDERLRNTF